MTDGCAGARSSVPNLSRSELIVTLANDATPCRGRGRALRRRGERARWSESTDPAQPLADVDIDAEPLAVAPLNSIEIALSAPLVAAAADLVGVADAALHRSVEHAKARRQFGSPIGAFQGIKHALADNYVGLERARSLTYAAAALLGDPNAAPADVWTAAALAKAAAGDAAANSARTAVQVHGALGQTWEHDAHLYVRHAWQGAAMLGDSRSLYHEVGRRFCGGAPQRHERSDGETVRAPWSRNSPHGWRTSCPTTITTTIASTAGIYPCGATTSGPLSRPAGYNRLGRASTAVGRWACATRWKYGSRPHCGPRPSCPTLPGPGVAAPGIRQFGTPAQIDRLLVPLLRGDEWWALGMSEPEAGSDFAGLRTRAERDGDVFRVNGHKIWTTQAHESRWCTLYARTDPDAAETPRHLVPHPRYALARSKSRAHPDGVDLRRDVLRGVPRRRRGAGGKPVGATQRRVERRVLVVAP